MGPDEAHRAKDDHAERSADPVGSWQFAAAPPTVTCVNTDPPFLTVLGRDGLRIGGVATPLRAWARNQADVERLLLDYELSRYLIVVKLRRLSLRRMADIHSELEPIRCVFQGADVQVHILGPQQRGCSLLTSRRAYCVHPATADED